MREKSASVAALLLKFHGRDGAVKGAHRLRVLIDGVAGHSFSRFRVHTAGQLAHDVERFLNFHSQSSRSKTRMVR
jgi:hypothetical protein